MCAKTGNRIVRLILASMFVVVAGCDLLVSDQARLEKARHSLATGEHRTAIIQLKKLLQSTPDHGEGRLLLGQASLASGDFAAAEKELVRARELGIPAKETMVPLGHALLAQGRFETALEELDPSAVDETKTRVDILMLRGDAHLASRNLDEAEKSFRDALALQPDAPDPRIGLARVEWGRGKLKAAEDYIGAVVAADPSHVGAWLAAGELKMAQRNFTAAEIAFTRALEGTAPRLTLTQEFIARSGLVESQWRQGESEAALANIERLLKLAPRHPRPKYFRALIAYGAGDYETAVQQLQQALRFAPDYRLAQLLLGATHYAQGNLEQADMYLSSMLAADPSNLPARKLLAATRLRQQKPRDAMATLTPAMGRGSDIELLGLMGRASLQAGDADSGISYLERGAKADPENEALQLELAAGYLTAGELEQAIEILEKLPETQEGLYRRELLLILAHLRKRDTSSALAEGEKLLAKRPGDAGAHNLVGSIHLADGQLVKARQYFEKALALQPDNVTVLMNLGRVDFREGKNDGARARFERVLQASPKNINAMIALAQLAGLRGDQEQVTQWLERASSADPQAIAPKLLLVRHYLGGGQIDAARTLAEELAKTRPQNPDAQNALGVIQMIDRKYREAVESFRNAIKAAPNSADLHYNQARAQLALRNFGEAKQILAKMLALQPNHVRAISALAALEAQEGATDQALTRARKLQQSDSKSPIGYALEGDLYMMQRSFASAARAYEAALTRAESRVLVIKLHEARQRANRPDSTKPLESWLAKHPDDATVRLVLAQAYQRQGEPKTAIYQYELLLKNQPNNAVALNNLAWLYHENKDPRAVEIAKRAHELRPQDGAITDTFGWLLLESGEIQRGTELLRRAAEQAPNVPEIRYHLAVALVKAGAREEARKTLKELINSGKSFKDLAKAKELLQQL